MKCLRIPWNDGSAEHRTISAQDLSVNQSDAGFGNLFSRATPPVNKKRHSCSSILPLKIQPTNKIYHLLTTTYIYWSKYLWDKLQRKMYFSHESLSNLYPIRYSEPQDKFLTFILLKLKKITHILHVWLSLITLVHLKTSNFIVLFYYIIHLFWRSERAK